MSTTPTFTWLHLTDLHVGMSVGRAQWPAAEFNVLEDLARCVRQLNTSIEAIFFTGDLTQRGSANEYAEFDQILLKIRKAIADAGGGQPAFIAVPGNHDLDRSEATKDLPSVTVLRNLEAYPDIREAFWKSSENPMRKTIASSFSQWTKWSDHAIDWNSLVDVERKSAQFPGEFAATLRCGNFRIGLLGINTASIQLSEGDYRGKLLLSGLQATALVDRAYEWSAQHDACFLLSHHPPSWLDKLGQEAYRNDVGNPNWFDLHLCGHCHEQQRQTVVLGGQTQLRLSVGRSLFGLEEYDDSGKKKRLFGYSFGQITFGAERNLRFWPRADQPKQGGTWVVEEDHSEAHLDAMDRGTRPETLGNSRRNNWQSGSAKVDFLPLSGWQVVDQAFLARALSDIRPEDIPSYFDGDDPQWPAIASQRIPERQQVQQVENVLLAAQHERCTVHLLAGPGGEGKTTTLMQVAARLARRGDWTVLWRRNASLGDPGRIDWSDIERFLRPNSALCLAIDDAHEIRQELRDFLERSRVDSALRTMSGSTLHLLLCSHRDDWARAKARGERWRAAEIPLEPLNRLDADSIARAYRRERALGPLLTELSDDEVAETLLKNARSSSGNSEAALLGSLIEARTGLPLEIHIERILERIADAGQTSKLPTMHCFIGTAAANAAGVHRLPELVLAETVAETVSTIQDSIALVASELRAEGYGMYRTIRVRHAAIARRALATSFGSLPNSAIYADKARTYRHLATALVRNVPDYWRSPIVSPVLELCVSRRRSDPLLAVAIAEGAVDGAPSDVHLRSRLSQTYREAGDGDPIAAVSTCVDFFRRFPKTPNRVLAREWAIASGERLDLEDHAARSLWIALYSFSDQCGANAFPPNHLRHLPTITHALALDAGAFDDVERRRIAAAVLSVATLVSGMPHIDEIERLAEDSPFPADVSELAQCLEQAASTAWSKLNSSTFQETFLPSDGKLTFTALSQVVNLL